jgi:hypothetical protein
MAKYRVYNNTDLNTPFETNNRRKAEAVWRQIRPRADAGNLYSAHFEVRCENCGNWTSATEEYNTCSCQMVIRPEER